MDLTQNILTYAVLSLAFISVSAQELQPPSTTTRAAVSTFTVEVGKGDHAFRPDVIQAKMGDSVQFNFNPLNHSVVRAAYRYPCVPYEKIFVGEPGFFSGFHPVDAILTDSPSWSIRINDSEPIFFYCSAQGSCIDWQMVGVINPNSTQLLSTQKLFAANASYMLQPGDPFPDEDEATTTQTRPLVPSPRTSVTVDGKSTATGSSTAAMPNAANFPPGAIAGTVVGVVVIMTLAAALCFLIGRRRTTKDKEPDTMPARDVQSPVFPAAGPIMSPNDIVHYSRLDNRDVTSPTYTLHSNSAMYPNVYQVPVEMDSSTSKENKFDLNDGATGLSSK